MRAVIARWQGGGITRELRARREEEGRHGMFNLWKDIHYWVGNEGSCNV
jgi:hypothetical protein